VAGAVGAKVADVAPESIPGDLSEENEDLMGGLFGALGVQLSGLSDDLLGAHPLGDFGAKGQDGAAIGLALGLGLLAAKERGLPFADDFEGWLLRGDEPEEEPQRRTSVGPNAIPPPQWGRRP
jgi:hypothetical protein